ncbi:MAG: thioredoxin-disulfide reductase [Planctomycetota bacterium]|nr:thioredoxin-disulfide reductase [Planctomycetota bacterium]
MTATTAREMYDVLIIGAGPAGLSAAVYAGRAALKTLLLERSEAGGQMALTLDIANFPGFPDGIDGAELSARMRKHAERFGVEIRQFEARRIERAEGGFHVLGESERLAGRAVIVATGASPRLLGVPGEKELRGRGVSYCATCDGPFFRNQEVVVVGGGDAALKESLHLVKFASRLAIVHRRDAFRGEKIYQKEIFQHPKIEVLWNTVVSRINGQKRVESVTLRDLKTDKTYERPVQGVFIFIGSVPNTDLLASLLPENAGGLVPTNGDMMTRIPGLFAIGDVRLGSYRQIATALGDGAIAAMAAERYLLHPPSPAESENARPLA